MTSIIVIYFHIYPVCLKLSVNIFKEKKERYNGGVHSMFETEQQWVIRNKTVIDYTDIPELREYSYGLCLPLENTQDLDTN